MILDQTDMLFTLGRAAGDPEGRHRRKVTTVKCRIDEEPPPRWVRIDADRDRGLVLVDEAEPFEEEGTARPRDQHRDQVLELLGGIARSERNIAKASDLPRTTVQRLLCDLEAEELAKRSDGGWVAHRPVALVSGPGGPPRQNGHENGSVEPNRGWPTSDALGHPQNGSNEHVSRSAIFDDDDWDGAS